MPQQASDEVIPNLCDADAVLVGLALVRGAGHKGEVRRAMRTVSGAQSWVTVVGRSSGTQSWAQSHFVWLGERNALDRVLTD